MKAKFEKNVAKEMPKTKSREPELPWKVDSDDIARIKSADADYDSISRETSPLKVRAGFLIALIVAIFITGSYLVMNVSVENGNIRLDMSKNTEMLSDLQNNLEKVASEKTYLSESFSQLEKRVVDVSAQNELFTTVIESLTTKDEEVGPDKATL